MSTKRILRVAKECITGMASNNNININIRMKQHSLCNPINLMFFAQNISNTRKSNMLLKSKLMVAMLAETISVAGCSEGQKKSASMNMTAKAAPF